MKIAIIGAGAMGCRYGEALARTGNEVVLVDVWKEHVDKINAQGLLVIHQDRTEQVIIKAATSGEAAYAALGGFADLVMLFTKSMHSKVALSGADPLIGAKTLLMTLQNGLGNVEVLEAVAPRERIIAGTTDFPSDLHGPGAIMVTGEGHTRFQLVDPLSSFRKAFSDILTRFEKAGLNPEAPEQIMPVIWAKVAFNACANSLTAITKLPVGYVGASEPCWEIMRGIVSEAMQVAASEGIKLDGDAVLNTLYKVSRPGAHFNHLPSMLQDVLAKKQTEIAGINGAIVERGKKAGIPTPYNHCLASLVQAVQANYENQRTS